MIYLISDPRETRSKEEGNLLIVGNRGRAAGRVGEGRAETWRELSTNGWGRRVRKGTGTSPGDPQQGMDNL